MAVQLLLLFAVGTLPQLLRLPVLLPLCLLLRSLLRFTGQLLGVDLLLANTTGTTRQKTAYNTPTATTKDNLKQPENKVNYATRT